MVTGEDLKRWEAIDREILLLESFNKTVSGRIVYNGKIITAELDRKGRQPVFRLGIVDGNDLNVDNSFGFSDDATDYKVTGTTTAHRNSVKVKKGLATDFTEGIIDVIKSTQWRGGKGRFRSYYRASSKKTLYHIFENPGRLDLEIDNQLLYLFLDEHFDH